MPSNGKVAGLIPTPVMCQSAAGWDVEPYIDPTAPATHSAGPKPGEMGRAELERPSDINLKPNQYAEHSTLLPQPLQKGKELKERKKHLVLNCSPHRVKKTCLFTKVAHTACQKKPVLMLVLSCI